MLFHIIDQQVILIVNGNSQEVLSLYVNGFEGLAFSIFEKFFISNNLFFFVIIRFVIKCYMSV